MARSRKESLRLNHDYIGTEHILLALLDDSSAEIRAYLDSRSVRPVEIATRIENSVASGLPPPKRSQLPLTPSAKAVLDEAVQETRSTIREEHVFVGLLQESRGTAGRILRELGLFPADAREYFGIEWRSARRSRAQNEEEGQCLRCGNVLDRDENTCRHCGWTFLESEDGTTPSA